MIADAPVHISLILWFGGHFVFWRPFCFSKCFQNLFRLSIRTSMQNLDSGVCSSKNGWVNPWRPWDPLLLTPLTDFFVCNNQGEHWMEVLRIQLFTGKSCRGWHSWHSGRIQWMTVHWLWCLDEKLRCMIGTQIMVSNGAKYIPSTPC